MSSDHVGLPDGCLVLLGVGFTVGYDVGVLVAIVHLPIMHTDSLQQSCAYPSRLHCSPTRCPHIAFEGPRWANRWIS